MYPLYTLSNWTDFYVVITYFSSAIQLLLGLEKNVYLIPPPPNRKSFYGIWYIDVRLEH